MSELAFSKHINSDYLNPKITSSGAFQEVKLGIKKPRKCSYCNNVFDHPDPRELGRIIQRHVQRKHLTEMDSVIEYVPQNNPTSKATTTEHQLIQKSKATSMWEDKPELLAECLSLTEYQEQNAIFTEESFQDKKTNEQMLQERIFELEQRLARIAKITSLNL